MCDGENIMRNLTDASQQLFERTQDERFDSLQALWDRCQQDKQLSRDRWVPPEKIQVEPGGPRLGLRLEDAEFRLNDWSFGQVCRLASVNKETVNRLSRDTAASVLEETLPLGNKPLQVLTQNEEVRAVHGASYTRLYNVDLLTMVREFATDFEPPPVGCNGGTGLYCGEQDMFCFLIDPAGWTEINGEAFAPGFFLWNSEVGRRTLGVKTFWFQAVCQNHIVWDAVEVVEFTRKHTANVHDGLAEIREIIARLVESRDRRRDGFVATIKSAMEHQLSNSADEVLDLLKDHGFTRTLAKQAVELAAQQGRFTVFTVVDALTRIAGRMDFAGVRVETDEKAGQLLTLVA